MCHRAHQGHGEPYCQSIAGTSVDEAIGTLVSREMTPAAVELTLQIRREIEKQYHEADQLHARAVEPRQIEADRARRRFMLVDPENRLVADTLEAEWNDKLRVLAAAREQQRRANQENKVFLDEAVHKRLVAMTADFQTIWTNPATPNRERKRLLASIIEDATLIKIPAEGVTKVHVQFKGGKTETLTAVNPKSSAQRVKTPPEIVQLVDRLLDDHIYSEIADMLNEQGFRPGGTARPGRSADRFDRRKVVYLAHRYGLLPRFDRLRRRGMLTGQEAAKRLGIHEATLMAWAQHGIVTRHMYNGHAWLFEISELQVPSKHPSRWDRLEDRAARIANQRPYVDQ